MKNARNKSKAATIVLVLMLTISALIVTLPAAGAQIAVNLSPMLEPVIGLNSPTQFTWRPSPNMLLTDPLYADEIYVWPDATATFTRPDASTDVVSGPFKTRTGVPGDQNRRDIILVYTPDMKGDWTIEFSWPGDDTYAAASRVNTFTVGDHFEKRPTYPHLSLRPYPAIGIGQYLLVNAWITPPPMTERDNFENYTFTIKKPDGTTAYTFEMDSEMGGYVWWEFVFDELGDWTITYAFPGDHLTEPSSVTRTITVQLDPIPYEADTPLPTEAWTFPVSVYNREWRNIAGPWYQMHYNASLGAFNPYTEAPRAAHILWKLDPVSGVGGFIGATPDDPGIETSDIYSSSEATIETVMAGRGYYTAAGMIHCVDIFTGEELWSVPGSFTVGATRSRQPVLYQFGSTFRVYNALTGAVTLEVPGLSAYGGWFTAPFFDDPYVLSSSGGRWIKWSTAGSTSNFANRVVWNVTNPWPEYSQFDFMASLYDNLFIQRMQKWWVGPYGSCMVEAVGAINMDTGEEEYFTEIIEYDDTSTWGVQQGPHSGAAYGLLFYSVTGLPYHMEEPGKTGGFNAFDVTTGELAWLSEPYDTYPWGNFHCYNPIAAGYNMIYDLGYSGIHALNATNGEVVWYYSAGDAGMETPYNTWAFGSTGAVLGGGVLFAPNTEHSPTLYYRGEQLHAVDAFTGDKLWSIQGYYNPTAVAYGILLASDNPNGFTYAFGKGETATTVSASSKVISKGSSILIEGTVLDMSPAQPNTAAISDASMSDWMEYLHMQQPIPGDATGVQVKLQAVSSDGTVIDIGTVTSDMSGLYKKMWTPTVEGEYTIIATFEGSESYYASYAETAVGVGPAASASAPIEPEEPTEPTEPTEAPFITTEVAIILAVVAAVIIGIVAYWTLRKRQ